MSEVIQSSLWVCLSASYPVGLLTLPHPLCDHLSQEGREGGREEGRREGPGLNTAFLGLLKSVPAPSTMQTMTRSSSHTILPAPIHWLIPGQVRSPPHEKGLLWTNCYSSSAMLSPEHSTSGSAPGPQPRHGALDKYLSQSLVLLVGNSGNNA